jgi:hypothetical protein
MNEEMVGPVGELTIVIFPSPPAVTALNVALTKIPRVPAVEPAVNVTLYPLPVSDPKPPFVRVHTYVMPLPGQVELHVGVAVNGIEPPVPRVAGDGLTATDSRVTDEAAIVISVEVSLVTPLRVAFTKIPTVPAVAPATKLTEAPEPVIVPIVLFVRDHE